jgi:uncharacterized Zn finger protein
MTEPHFHVCRKCGTSWSHSKSLIPTGRQFVVHECPRCGQYCNDRYDFADVPSVGIDFPDWYGGESCSVERGDSL